MAAGSSAPELFSSIVAISSPAASEVLLILPAVVPEEKVDASLAESSERPLMLCIPCGLLVWISFRLGLCRIWVWAP